MQNMILFANAGIPMLAIFWPFLWVAFIPITFIESFVVQRIIRIPFKTTFYAVLVANALSTIVGIPLTWFALLFSSLFIQIVGFGEIVPSVLINAPWIGPAGPEMTRMVATAALILCVPFFFASVGIEYLMMRKMLKGKTENIGSACWVANTISYALIMAFWAVRLVM
jgi:hypothetical protein